jgi:hypothetical protein
MVGIESAGGRKARDWRTTHVARSEIVEGNRPT